MKKFGLSLQERKGFLLGILFVTLLFCIPLVFKGVINQKELEIVVEYIHDTKLSQTNSQKKKEAKYKNEFGMKGERVKSIKGERFAFDPNTISSNDWKRLGLSEKQAEVILKYRERGGIFRVKEDLKKMYVVSDELYDHLESFIHISEPQNIYVSGEKTIKTKDKFTQSNLKIELNSSDTTELMQLRGIGPVFSKRIIKYRDLLGGFYAVEQLKDVYGLEQTYEDIEEYLTVDTTLITKIQINTISEAELSKHPYINYKEAKIIINYREQHGGFENETDLERIKGLDIGKVSRILPYLAF